VAGGAAGELARATDAPEQKQQRAGVTQARRAAAWRGTRSSSASPIGRTRPLRPQLHGSPAHPQQDAAVSAAVREAATALVRAPLEQILVQLGSGDTRLASAAAVIVEEAGRG